MTKERRYAFTRSLLSRALSNKSAILDRIRDVVFKKVSLFPEFYFSCRSMLVVCKRFFLKKRLSSSQACYMCNLGKLHNSWIWWKEKRLVFCTRVKSVRIRMVSIFFVKVSFFPLFSVRPIATCPVIVWCVGPNLLLLFLWLHQYIFYQTSVSSCFEHMPW